LNDRVTIADIYQYLGHPPAIHVELYARDVEDDEQHPALFDALSIGSFLVDRCRVRLAMGTDSGVPFTRHGNNLDELQHLVEMGAVPTRGNSGGDLG
jgi:hypothetical protein